MPRAKSDLVHSVAFRVSEDQWKALQRYAQNSGTTIPQVAKATLFETVGLTVRDEGRRRYGQRRRGNRGPKDDHT